MRISKCAWCGKGRRHVGRDYGNPSGVAVMAHSERFHSLQMHTVCIYAFVDSIRKLTRMDPYSVPFVAKEFGGIYADEIRNA